MFSIISFDWVIYMPHIVNESPFPGDPTTFVDIEWYIEPPKTEEGLYIWSWSEINDKDKNKEASVAIAGALANATTREEESLRWILQGETEVWPDGMTQIDNFRVLRWEDEEGGDLVYRVYTIRVTFDIAPSINEASWNSVIYGSTAAGRGLQKENGISVASLNGTNTSPASGLAFGWALDEAFPVYAAVQGDARADFVNHPPQTIQTQYGALKGTLPDGGFGCFIYGTIFHTLKDNTEVPIEIQNLKVGDLVKTEVYVNQMECQFSLDAWQRIKRMIRRPLTADEYANKTRILPKDAFGPGKPDKDLHVTWGHGLLLKEMKEEWKNDEYDGNHVTYSKEHALVKGDFIKLLAGHCALCRKPNEEENKKADEEREKRAYYHLELEGKEKVAQHALVTHGVTSESLVHL